jgi:branched-chain amino acid transport system ATP-binding protein
VILAADDIFKSYGDFGVLAGVSFQIREGEFVSIIGPNGAGKTTLINVLTGLLKPNKGRVFFKEHDITGIGPSRLSRMGMARSFQLVNIFPTFTVMEFIKLGVLSRQGKGARFYTTLDHDREVTEEAEEIMQIFHFGDKRDVQAKNLPQGDKKLLDVASAFALRPEVILLDEPTSGVSTSEKNRIMEILIDASKRVGIKSIIQVEHDMDLVFGFSDRIIALHSGKVLADCTPDEMEKNEAAMCAVVGEKGCFKICSSLLS